MEKCNACGKSGKNMEKFNICKAVGQVKSLMITIRILKVINDELPAILPEVCTFARIITSNSKYINICNIRISKSRNKVPQLAWHTI
jgi:hypothetical protein